MQEHFKGHDLLIYVQLANYSIVNNSYYFYGYKKVPKTLIISKSIIAHLTITVLGIYLSILLFRAITRLAD